MEYTILSVIFLVATFFYALYAKINIRMLIILCFVSLFFQLIFDNYMTSLGLWIFDYSHTVGIKLPIIPLENLIFGVSLTLATVATWEILKQ